MFAGPRSPRPVRTLAHQCVEQHAGVSTQLPVCLRSGRREPHPGLDGGPQIAELAEGVSVVDPLVDAADQGQGTHRGVGDLAEQCLGEALGVYDAERSIEVVAGGRLDGFAEGAVLQDGGGFIRRDQVLLALVPVRCPLCRRESGRDVGDAGQAAERGTEPFAVRRVAAMKQQAQPHDVVREPGGDVR